MKSQILSAVKKAKNISRDVLASGVKASAKIRPAALIFLSLAVAFLKRRWEAVRTQSGKIDFAAMRSSLRTAVVVEAKKNPVVYLIVAALAFGNVSLLTQMSGYQQRAHKETQKVVAEIRKEIIATMRAEDAIYARIQRRHAEESIKGDAEIPSRPDVHAINLDKHAGADLLNQPLSNAVLGRYVAGALDSQQDGNAQQSSQSGGAQNSDSQSQDIHVPGDLGRSDYQRSQKSNAVERALIQEGGILLPRGTLQLEPGFTTAHFSSNRINIEGFSILPVLVIGEISTESVQRDIFISSMSVKYGLWNNLQVDLKVPYRYEFDRMTSNLGEETTREAQDWGDVESSASYQIIHANGWIPDVIFSTGVKTANGKDPYRSPVGLGTGHWGFRAGLVAVKSSDPAVIFGTLNYTANLAENYEEIGNIDPGNTVSFGFGTAIALSYQTAINFSFEQSVSSKTKIDNIDVNGSFLNAATLKTGFTWTVSERMSIDMGLGAGLTTDSPDYIFDLRVPYTF